MPPSRRIALWQALWEQYSACLKPLLEGDAELQGVKAKLLQRGLYVGKQLRASCTASRAALPPPTLWQELHAYYRLAEMLDCAVTAVSDDLQPHAVGISCYSTYCHALLLGLADPCAMSVRQIELADRWLGQWARKVFPYAQQRETEGPVMLHRPRLVGRARGSRPRRRAIRRASMRFGYPGQARDQRARPAEAARRRRQSRRAAARPRHVGRRLAPRCCRISTRTGTSCRGATPMPAHDASSSSSAGGVPAAYFRVGGRTFDRQDPLGRLTFQGAQHLQTLGALTDYDRYKEEAERNWPWERWQGDYEWRDAELLRRDDRRATAGSSTSSSSCATTSACAWAT